MSEKIMALASQADPPLRWLCIECSSIDDVDYSGAETLRSIFETLKEKGVRLVVAMVPEEVRATSRYQLQELFGADAFFGTLGDMVSAYRRQLGG